MGGAGTADLAGSSPATGGSGAEGQESGPARKPQRAPAAPGVKLARRKAVKRLVPKRKQNRTMFRLLSLLLAAGLTSPLHAGQPPPGYRWQDLGNGVHVHQRVDALAGPVDGNSVVIIGGHGVVVVDTHINPAAARAVIARIRDLTDKPVTHVINTHWHDDHTNGNHAFRQAYPEARIVSHRATLAALKREWAPMEAQRREAYASLTAGQLLEAAAKHAGSDPQKAASYRVYAGYVAALKPELAAMELVYPDTLLEDKLILDPGGRRIELRWLGRGNTDGDVVAWLPDDKLLITGDLLVAPIPYAFDSPMSEWVATLGKVLEFEAETIVPGHGAIQHDGSYVEQVRGLLRDTLAAVSRAHEEGIAFADLAQAVDLGPQQGVFTAGDAGLIHAWNDYYLTPGLKSAWVSLGFPLPAED